MLSGYLIGWPVLRDLARALPGVRMLALLAFSLYLTHRQVVAWLDGVAGDLAANAPFSAFVLYNGASLAMAALLYVAVERPGLRMRRGTPRRQPGALAG